MRKIRSWCKRVARVLTRPFRSPSRAELEDILRQIATDLHTGLHHIDCRLDVLEQRLGGLAEQLAQIQARPDVLDVLDHRLDEHVKAVWSLIYENQRLAHRLFHDAETMSELSIGIEQLTLDLVDHTRMLLAEIRSVAPNDHNPADQICASEAADEMDVMHLAPPT